MRRLWFTVTLFTAAYTILNDAQAGETLAERKRWKNEAEYARTDVRQTGDRCGTHVDLEFDRASFRGFPSGSSVHANCLTAHHALKALCESDPEARKIVVTRVRKIICVYSKQKTALTFDGTSLRFDANPADPDLKATVTQALAETLKPASKVPEVAVGN